MTYEYEDSEPCRVCGKPVNDGDYHAYGYCEGCSIGLRKVLQGDLNLIEGGLMEKIFECCSPETVKDLMKIR